MKNTRALGVHARYCKPTDAQLFWVKVDKNGPNGCWVWTAYCQRRGHGWTGQKNGLAHRFAWTLMRGPLKPTDCLLHKCDNPPCVNPEHLYVGDRKDNWQDAKARNPNPAIGSSTFHAFLTEAQVIEIIRDYRKTGPRRSNIRELRPRYPGISSASIVHAALGRTWKYLHARQSAALNDEGKK